MELNKVWPEWQVVDKLGEGSYGKVYRCTSEKNGIKRESAIKVISVPQSETEHESLRREGMTEDTIKNYFYDMVQNFTNEIHVMEVLQGTKNIVSVEDYKVVERKDEIGWDIYIRMELLKGFRQYSEEHKMSEADVAKLGKDICIALEECEKRKILHRDIKPENIFIDSDGNFKIGDFGVARQLENTSTTMSQKGTYNYMAPEVVSKKKGDCRADIYSLGMVMYKLLNNNREPFIDPDKQMIRYRERVDAVEKRLNGEKLPAPKNASEEMANVILNACEFDKENRYASAAEFRKAIETVVPSESVSIKSRTKSVSSKVRLFVRMNKSKLAISALSLLLVACIVGGSVAVVKYRKYKSKSLNTDNNSFNQAIENNVNSVKTTASDEVIFLDVDSTDKFGGLSEIMETVNYFKGFYDRDIGEYEYFEYDCASDDIYEKIAKEYFASRISLMYKYLFGESKYRTLDCSSDPDPLNKYADSYYMKIAEDDMKIIVEKVFNLNIEKLIKTDALKDFWYLHDGYYYCKAPSNTGESTVEFQYISDTMEDNKKHIVQLGAFVKDSNDNYIYIAEWTVECAYLEYKGIRFWSIYKTSIKEVYPNEIKIWRNGYADQMSKVLNNKNLSKKKPCFDLVQLDYDDIPELLISYENGDTIKQSIYSIYNNKIVYLGDYYLNAYDRETAQFAFNVCAPMNEFYLYEIVGEKVNTICTGDYDEPGSEKYYINNKSVSYDEYQGKVDEFLEIYNTFKEYDDSNAKEITQERIEWVRKNAMLEELTA